MHTEVVAFQNLAAWRAIGESSWSSWPRRCLQGDEGSAARLRVFQEVAPAWHASKNGDAKSGAWLSFGHLPTAEVLGPRSWLPTDLGQGLLGRRDGGNGIAAETPRERKELRRGCGRRLTPSLRHSHQARPKALIRSYVGPERRLGRTVCVYGGDDSPCTVCYQSGRGRGVRAWMHGASEPASESSRETVDSSPPGLPARSSRFARSRQQGSRTVQSYAGRQAQRSQQDC